MLQVIVLYGAVLPALAVAVAMLAAWRPWRQQYGASVPWGAAVGLAAAFSITQFGLVGRTSFPPREPYQWIVFVVLFAAALEVLVSSVRLPCCTRCPLRGLLAALTAWLTVPAFHSHPSLAAWTVVAAVLILSRGLQNAALQVRGAAAPMAWLMAATAMAIVLERSANAKLAQLSGSLAAGMGVIFLMGLWKPTWPVAARAGSILAVAFPALLVNGHATSDEIPGIAYVLAGLSPLGVWLAAGHEMRRLSGWKRAIAAATGVLIPASIAVAIAVQATLSAGYP